MDVDVELRNADQIVHDASRGLLPSSISRRSESGQQQHDPRRDHLLLQQGPHRCSRTVQQRNQRICPLFLRDVASC